MYKTKITSQGTISLPAALRKKYDLKPGETVILEDNGRITIVKNADFETLRSQNSKYMKPKPDELRGGDGFTSHVVEHYGKN
jgi:AbrB family looped-hinge helix DNA binding protein